MNRGPTRTGCCDFCGAPRAEVLVLFRSKRGGMPPAICDGCVDQVADALTEARRSIVELPHGPRTIATGIAP